MTRGTHSKENMDHIQTEEAKLALKTSLEQVVPSNAAAAAMTERDGEAGIDTVEAATTLLTDSASF